MRIPRAIVATALGLASCSVSGAALGQHLRLGAGATLPLEPESFTDLYDFGLHGGAELTGAVNRTKTAHLGLAAYHHRFPLDEDEAFAEAGGAPLEASGGTYVITEVYGVGHFELNTAATRPFLVVGLGIAHVYATDLSVTVGGQKRTTSFDSEAEVFYTLGIGVKHRVGDVALFGQVRLASVQTEDATMFVPLTIGVEL